jgi:hypothetical protein
MSPLPPKADTRQHKRHVRFGSLGDICNAASDVRFAPNGDRESGHAENGHVCFTPNDFSERYGEIGKGFIEAHHLRPIASLQEGIAVTYDIAADFAVLCSNCHRMIHRSADPSDLALFRENVTSNKT